MRSKLAEDLARESDLAVQRMPVSERVALALRLGEEALRTFAAPNQLSDEEARHILRRNNQIGRRASKVMSDE
ncbi:MAG TPA: hypothetical protein VN634_11975 [Candidatus Limnocylindrales bacterium]|nr:hypothetical protein [Candidatus Limnocylindrales bacterium]